MALKAARLALRDAAADPLDLGAVIYAGFGPYDYQFWSPAAKLAHELGARHAYAFEVRNACTAANLGVTLAAGLMHRDPTVNAALVVCADKLSRYLNYADVRAHSLFIIGDGAAAAVVRRAEPSNTVLAYAEITDGALADQLKIPLGGTRVPFRPDPALVPLGYVTVEDPEGLARMLGPIYLEHYLSVIRQALEKSGHAVAEIDFLVMNQVKRSLADEILHQLGLGPEQTYRSLETHGHMGPVDVLYCLAKAREAGLVRPGSLVVLATSAAGFSWAATVVRF
jgi:3-oxoacyl-[acyl-carrier-protein] synthase-3